VDWWYWSLVVVQGMGLIIGLPLFSFALSFKIPQPSTIGVDEKTRRVTGQLAKTAGSLD
jgi:hypothetical protein